jgi:hypothetical protein
MNKGKWGEGRLFLEETAELIHHAGATAVGGGRATLVATTVAGRAIGALVTVVVAVLLDSVLSNAAHDGSTDRSEEAVVSLVAGETTGGTTGESASKATLAFLGFTGSTLLLVATVTEKQVSIMNWNDEMEGKVGAEM